MRFRSLLRTVALASVVGIVATACGGGGDTNQRTGQQPVRGGNAVFGAEQWPQCLHPLTSCNFATWYHLVTAQLVLPKLMMIDRQNNVVASPVLAQAPSLDNGLITQNPFTITYRLNPQAKWEDGSPITSEDVRFTWLAVMNTTGSNVTSGYDKIEDVATPDPQTAVLRFSEPYAAWADLMGGGNVNGYLLKKAAFPDADEQEPDLRAEFKNEIPFSGGPWRLQSFSKSQAVLVPNQNYWGQKPYLNQVTFIPIEEQPQEVAALLSGEVGAIFPQASNVSVTAQLSRNPRIDFVTGATNYGDALWLNVKKPPLNDRLVREALGYAIDRQAVINTIIKLNNPNARVLNCIPPTFEVIKPWCDQTDFARFSYNPQRSLQLLQQAGWDCSTKPCTKNGQKLSIVDFVSAGNQRRIATGQLIKEKALAAGFEINVRENDATDLFSNKLPQGDYQMADYASGAIVDPSPTSSYSCDAIPTPENDFGGTNTNFYCNPQLDRLMEQSDRELDQARRLQLIRQINDQLARDVVAIPLYSFVNITGWRTDKVAGPVGTWNSASYGTYMNIHEWFAPRAGAA